jgi:hypothetical protein
VVRSKRRAGRSWDYSVLVLVVRRFLLALCLFAISRLYGVVVKGWNGRIFFKKVEMFF